MRVVVAEAHTGAPLAEAHGAAPADGGPATVAVLFARVLAEAQTSISDVRAVCAGVTKVSRPGVVDAWHGELARLLPHVPPAGRAVVPDFVAAFTGATGGAPGLAVIAGTGSVVYGENETGDSARVGGRGWEFGDEGSGAYLTADLVRRTLRALDGMAAPTPLTRAVCAFLNADEAGELGRRARERAEQDGRGFLVPLVLAQARAGDGEARNLFVGAAGWLALPARAAAEKLAFPADAPLVVATVGGLWEAGDLITGPFTEVLKRWLPRAQVIAPRETPVRGAVRRARGLLADLFPSPGEVDNPQPRS